MTEHGKGISTRAGVPKDFKFEFVSILNNYFKFSGRATAPAAGACACMGKDKDHLAYGEIGPLMFRISTLAHFGRRPVSFGSARPCHRCLG